MKAFFTQVESLMPAAAIPQIDPGFKIALVKLFALSLFVAGAFSILVSFFAIRDLSGQLGWGVDFSVPV